MVKSLALVTALALVVAASAQDVKVEKYRLANGMTVILREDHSLPIATVNIWYRVGSKDEAPRRSGFAHLFEHLMFMGTKRVPTGQFDKIMEGGGGGNNASTTEDRTNYYDSGPANLLPTLLWLEADRIEALGKNIDQKKLDLQRDVVKNERRQNTENTPYGRAYEAISALMFPHGHPYDHSVIGTMDDLDAASVKDVQDFFATYYVPNNGSMVVAGDFKSAEIKPIIDRLFGSLPRANDVPRNANPDSTLPGVRRMTFVDRVQAPKVLMVWHSPAKYGPGDAEVSLAASILADGVSSRLYQRLVVREKLATEVSAFQDGRVLGSLFYVDVTANPAADLSKIEAIIDEELARLRKSGPTSEELKRQSTKLEVGLINSLQSIDQTADRLNEFEYFFGEPNSYARVLASYRAVTPGSMRKVLGKVLDPNSRLMIRVVPEVAAQAETNPRDAQPPLGTEAGFTAPTPETFTLSNGLTVRYWRRPELPLMDLSLLVRRGADLDPAGKVGLASMIADMLEQGAGTRDAQQFERDLDLLGASFNASADARSMRLSFNVLASNFSKAMPLYADALLRPRFDAAEFERVQRVRIADLEQENDSPGAVASKVARREYFGADHPLGRPVTGTPESVKTLSVPDLRSEASQLLQPQNAILFAAGSLPQDALKAELEKSLGGWKNQGAPLPPAKFDVPATRPLRVVFVDRPGAVQSNIRFYFPAPGYADPNRQTLEALGTILGGTFTSRLNQNLREDKGYTYGAGARYSFNPQLGYLTSSADVRTDVTGASIREFLAEFDRLRKGDVSDVEANKAASTRRAETIASLGSLGGLLAVAEGYELNGRPFSDFGTELIGLSTISAARLNAIANAGVPLENAVLVIVGDRKAVFEHLKGLPLPTPVEVKP